VQVERVPIASLRPDPDNVRQHDDDQIELIKSSLLEYGQQKPILAGHDGTVRAGSGTLVAAAAIGWTEIDVVRTDLDGARAQAYAIVDNHTTDRSWFDPDRLTAGLADLAESGIDLSGLGLAGETDETGDEDEDEPELVKHSVLPPPKMAWVLIGLPTVRFGEVAKAIEGLGRVPGILCETSVNGSDG